MNNMNFTKNAFTREKPTHIAGKVIPNNNQAISVDQIRSNMQTLRRGGQVVNSSFEDGIPVVEKPQIKSSQRSTSSKSEVERMRLQALKNVGKKW